MRQEERRGKGEKEHGGSVVHSHYFRMRIPISLSKRCPAGKRREKEGRNGEGLMWREGDIRDGFLTFILSPWLRFLIFGMGERGREFGWGGGGEGPLFFHYPSQPLTFLSVRW